MKTNLNRYLIFGLAIMLSFLTIVSSWFLVSISGSYTSSKMVTNPPVLAKNISNTKIDRSISRKLYPCLPKKTQELRLVSSLLVDKYSYHIIGVYTSLPKLPNGEPNYQETLVKLDEIGCSVVVPKEEWGAKTLSYYLPEKVACDLTVPVYRQAILDSGDKDKYQTELFDRSDETPGDLSYFFPEDICALKKLGVKVPRNTRIIQDINEILNQGQK